MKKRVKSKLNLVRGGAPNKWHRLLNEACLKGRALVTLHKKEFVLLPEDKYNDMKRQVMDLQSAMLSMLNALDSGADQLPCSTKTNNDPFNEITNDEFNPDS